MSDPIRVVVVEDSLTQRAHLVRLLEVDGDIDVVAQAGTRAEAVAEVLRHHPDVVTMDLEMPGTIAGDELAGIRAVRTIMAAAPVPILVISSHVRNQRSQAALDSLAAGAAEVQPRPQDAGDGSGTLLRTRVRTLRGVKVITRREPRLVAPVNTPTGHGRLIALGASTGGPPALATVIGELAGVDVPILVVQHIHDDFVESFTTWLGTNTGIPSVIAAHGMVPERNRIHVAPAGRHMRLDRGGRLTLTDKPKRLHMPSIDELFDSIADSAGATATAALLTGMGEDGARGLAAIARSGGMTFAQDEATSAVFGMPQAAVAHDQTVRVLPLEGIGGALRRATGNAA